MIGPRSERGERAPVADRLGDLRGRRGRIAGQIGDRAGDLQHAEIRARRPAEALAGLAQQPLAVVGRAAQVVGLAAAQHVVRLALPRQLHGARSRDALGDHGARLAGRRRARREFGHRQRGHVDLDVDAIEQRPGQLAQIARRDVGCAAAASGRIAVPAARAGVHRGDQLTGGGKIGLLRGARDRDAAAFERLAQHFEHVPVEFGQFAFLLLGLSIFQYAFISSTAAPAVTNLSVVMCWALVGLS